MTKSEYINEIKLQLFGYDYLESELDDERLGMIVDSAFKEVKRYIDTTKFITIPYAKCIDLTGFNCISVANVYRTEGNGGGAEASMQDPMYAQQWMIFSTGGTIYNLQNYLLNYMSYNTLLQMRNTTSTDLAFVEDRGVENGVRYHKLYINVAFDIPPAISVEYVPDYQSVDEIIEPYWEDIIKRLSIALTKIVLGRIRSRHTLSNALWTQDGELILAEGNEEITALRETLRVNSQLFYPID